jgi:hypothetical protein
MKVAIKPIQFEILTCFLSSYNPIIYSGNACETELYHGGHYLKIRVSIRPHQSVNQIRDTLTINTIFSDSIYDMSARETFKAEHFPFKPLSLLYRFYEGLNWNTEFRVNNVFIDTLYKKQYDFSSKYADSYSAHTIYNEINDEYQFIINIMLQEKEIYFLLFSNLHQENLGFGNEEFNSKADAISIEGKCPGALYSISCTIESGFNHQNLFKKELINLDTRVCRVQLISNVGNATSGVWTGVQAV